MGFITNPLQPCTGLLRAPAVCCGAFLNAGDVDGCSGPGHLRIVAGDRVEGRPVLVKTDT